MTLVCRTVHLSFFYHKRQKISKIKQNQKMPVPNVYVPWHLLPGLCFLPVPSHDRHF